MNDCTDNLQSYVYRWIDRFFKIFSWFDGWICSGGSACSVGSFTWCLQDQWPWNLWWYVVRLTHTRNWQRMHTSFITYARNPARGWFLRHDPMDKFQRLRKDLTINMRGLVQNPQNTQLLNLQFPMQMMHIYIYMQTHTYEEKLYFLWAHTYMYTWVCIICTITCSYVQFIVNTM